MTYGLRVLLDGVDVSCHALEPVEVAWGRVHPGDSFEPRRCTVGLDEVANPQRGQTLQVDINAPSSNPQWQYTPGTWATQVGTWLARRKSVVLFYGRITDTQTSWQPVVPHTDWAVVVDVVAVDPVAELARTNVGDVPWPQETISARAARIEALTGLTWLNDSSSAVVLARDVDLQPALDLLDELAHWGSLAGGIFYDPSRALARFALDAMRGSRDPALILSSCQILMDANASQSVGDVVNDVTVTYRNPADLNAQPSVRVTSAPSIASNGQRGKSISTELVSSTVASQRANAEVTRFAVAADRWQSVVLDSRVLTGAGIAEQVLAAGPGLRLRLSELPAPSEPLWDGYLEGWTFQGLADLWTTEVNLSPATWSGPLLSWAYAVQPGALALNPNPGFEATPWIAGWTNFWRVPDAIWSEPITDGTAGEGLTFARMHNPTAYPDGFLRLQIWDPLAVAPGQAWHMKVLARTSSPGGEIGMTGVTNTAGGNPQYFADGAVAFAAPVQTIPVPADGFWHEYEQIATVPTDGRPYSTARFDVLARVDSGVIDIDNVRFFLPTNVGRWADVHVPWRWMDAVDEIRWET